MRSVPMVLVLLMAFFATGSRPEAQETWATPPSADYRFTAQAGLLVFHVHRERAGEFEQVMGRLASGLRGAPAGIRQEQAAGWRLFRARETTEASVYVLVFDPVVPQADYDPVKMLTELVPDEARPLYEQLRAAVLRIERLDLDRIQ